MRTVLFVDDEQGVLDGLRRMLFPLRREWNQLFAGSGEEALRMLDEHPVDVIVSDMRMPGMDGAALLREVRRRHPEVIRFVLTGQTDDESVYRTVGDAHQFLMKPCPPDVLKNAIGRALALRERLANPAVASLATEMGELPALPETYRQLCDELNSPEGSVANVGRIIEKDPAMTAKILQLVNSAFFGLRRPVSTASQAVAMLGLETIRSLVLGVGLFSHFERLQFAEGFSLRNLWDHSMETARAVHVISDMEKISPADTDALYTAALLHDAGEALLASGPREYFGHCAAFAELNEVSLEAAEREVFSCTHAELAAYLLGIWSLPDIIVEAVLFHHHPEEVNGEGLHGPLVLFCADVLCGHSDRVWSAHPDMEQPIKLLCGKGLEEKFGAWRKRWEEIQS